MTVRVIHELPNSSYCSNIPIGTIGEVIKFVRANGKIKAKVRLKSVLTYKFKIPAIIICPTQFLEVIS